MMVGFMLQLGYPMVLGAQRYLLNHILDVFVRVLLDDFNIQIIELQ